MNLRIRDNALYWFHRALAAAGRIHAPSLEEIRREGFRNVLVTATTAIGDAVLCTPLLDSLRAALPAGRIGFWTPAGAVPLFEGRSGLDEVIPYHGKYRRMGEAMERIRAGAYDLALVANANDPDVIPMIWWSGCRRIIRRPQRYTIYSFLVANPDMLSRSHTTGHAIERNLQFCDLLAIPRGAARTRLEVTSEAERRAAALLEGIPAPWRILHPGASRSKKQWGAANYAALGRCLLESPGSLLLTGSSAERGICGAVESALAAAGLRARVRNLAGQLRMDELAAVFRKASLLISGDTGPYHIAMAVGTPTVTLFAPWDIGSSPAINGPFFDPHRHRVVATPQIGDPISAIRVEQVFECCAAFLNATSQAEG